MWFLGMLVMSFSMHYAGLLGAPRRTADVAYSTVTAGTGGVSASWQPYMLLAAGGGTILFVSILMFVVVAIGTLWQNAKTESLEAEFAQPDPHFATPTPVVLQHLFRWGAVALVLAVLAYVGPVSEHLHNPGFLAPGERTW